MRVHVLGDDAMTSAFDQNAQKQQNAGAALTIAGGIAHGLGNHQAVSRLSAAHESIQKGSLLTAFSRSRGMGGNSFMRGDDDSGDDDDTSDTEIDNSDTTDNSVNTTNTTTNNAAGTNFWSFLSSAATAAAPLVTGALPAGTSKTSGSLLKVSGAPMKISPTMIIIGGAALVAAVVMVAKSSKKSASV